MPAGDVGRSAVQLLFSFFASFVLVVGARRQQDLDHGQVPVPAGSVWLITLITVIALCAYYCFGRAYTHIDIGALSVVRGQ